MSSDAKNNKTSEIEASKKNLSREANSNGSSDSAAERPEFPQASGVAERLRRLKDATVHLVDTRERLPQPLFWTVVHTEVAELRKRRAKTREEKRVFFYANSEE